MLDVPSSDAYYVIRREGMDDAIETCRMGEKQELCQETITWCHLVNINKNERKVKKENSSFKNIWKY